MESARSAWFRSETGRSKGDAFRDGAGGDSPHRHVEDAREVPRPMDGRQEPSNGPRQRSTVRFDRDFWLTAAVVAGVPLVALLAYHSVRFNGLTSPDAMDFAQIGRNLASGRGFSTFVLRPLALTHGTDAARQPDLVHGPLHPFVLALAFGMFGARDTVASIVSAALYLLTMPLLYVLGRQVFRPSVARVATLVFALNPVVLDMASSGLHIPLACFLATWLSLTLFRLLQAPQHSESGRSPEGNGRQTDADGASRRNLITAGVLTGLLYLTDPLFFWIVPALAAAAIWTRPAKGPSVLWFGAALAIVVLPWMIRNGLLTGNPVFGLRGAEVWMGTSVYPGVIGYRMMPGSLAPTAELFQAILQKTLIGVNQILTGLPQLSSTLVLAFFLPGLLYRLKEDAADGLRRTWLFCFVSLCVGMLLFGVHMSLLLTLLPALLLFSIAYISHLFQQARITRTGMVAACAVIAGATLYPLLNDLALSGRARLLPLRPAATLLGRQSRAGEVCVSDQPWAVAWYADRPALWIPARDEQMPQAASRVGGIRWLFVTDQVRSLSPTWESLYDSLADWNANWRRARVDKGEPPPAIVIDGMGEPLLEPLDGFASVAPADEQASNIVMAHGDAAPKAGSSGFPAGGAQDPGPSPEPEAPDSEPAAESSAP